MSDRASDDKRRSSPLSDALRAVRRVRKAKPGDLAKALGLSLRGYQNFEAGGGQINIAHVMRFARALDADPIGVLAAVQIGKPEFAAWVAQNKAMIAFMITLQEFAEETGEAMSRLETTTWVSAYREMFMSLSEKALAAQAQNDRWLAESAARLGLDSAPFDDDGTDGAPAQDLAEDEPNSGSKDPGEAGS